MNKDLSAVGVILIAIAATAACHGQDARRGLSESISREVRASEMLPKADYVEALAIEAEADGYSHLTGRAVQDPQASGGQAWGAEVDTDAPGHLLYGPYAEMKTGDYAAFFRIRITDELVDDIVGEIDACVSGGAKVLASRDLAASELGTDQYVQVPLVFHHPGGKLECRVRWNGSASLRVDRVAILRLEGAHLDKAPAIKTVAAPVASGLPKDLAYATTPRPFPELFPRSETPASNLLVFDMAKQPGDWQLLLYSLQGIVNREKPRIYFITNPMDKQWLDWIVKRGWIKSTETVSKADELVSRFRGSVKGAVIPDPKLPASKNVATMIAGVEGAVVVSSRLANKLSLPVVTDLRGRWKTSVEAYRWALDNLWPKMNHHVLACLWPDNYPLRDYLIQNRIFIFWIPGPIDGAKLYSTPNEEMRFAEELLAMTPPNTPIMGYSWAGQDIGIGEGGGVGLFSEFAKYLVGTVGSCNLSVHSGIRVDKFRQPVRPAPKLEKDKVYVCFTISDGDNLPVISAANWPQLWADKTRGEFPVGWTISPSAWMLIPGIMDYYYATATPNDTFMAAVSGVGYCYPESYAKRFRDADRGRAFDEFLGLTETHMREMDLRAVCPSLANVPEIERYAERVSSAQAVFPDYGRRVTDYADATYAATRGIPIFRAATTWDQNASPEERVTAMASQVRAMTPSSQPAFLHVFICNWFWDLPAMKAVLKDLGPDFVAVGPDELAALCRQDMEHRQVQVGKLPNVAYFDGQIVRLATSIRNISSRPADVRARVTGGLREATADQTRSLKPGEEFAVTISGIPAEESLRFDVSGSFGTRSDSASLLRVQTEELAGLIPEKSRLSSVIIYEAEALNHLSGKAQTDADASGKTVWASSADGKGPSYIVYGPYRSLDKGRYLAIFRLKRTGEGSGVATILDTSAGGGVKITSSRKVGVDELPVGAFRAFPLEFDHPGGAVETRVQWMGNAPVAVDYVALWEIARR